MAAPSVRNSSAAIAAEQRKQLAAILQGTKSAATPSAIQPAEGMYGVFSNAYVNKLGETTGAAGADLMNQLNLRSGAQREREEYGIMIAKAQAAQERMQKEGYFAGLQQAAGEALTDDAKQGIAGIRSVTRDADGRAILNVDPVMGRVNNQTVLSGREAERFGDVATGLKTAVEAGYGLSDLDARQKLTGPQDAYMPDIMPTRMTASDATARINSRTPEDDLALEEAKQRYKALYGTDDEEDGVEWKMEFNPRTGRKEWMAKGTSGALGSEGIRTPGASPPSMPNPKADGNGSVPSATSATEYYSNPNSKRGMRRDPITGRPKMHKGDDFARKANTPFPAERDGNVVSVGDVKGFGPNTVVVEYDDGERVLYGHGNAANVKPGQRVLAGTTLGLVGSQGRSTGPHVHRQTLQGPTRVVKADVPKRQDGTPARASRDAFLIARAKQAGYTVERNGADLIFTTPKGNKAVFRNGVRVSG